MKEKATPTYPVTVSFEENGEVWNLNSEEELACNLEWFNSDDPSEQATVIDRNGNKVRVVVEQLELKMFELYEKK